MLPGKSLLPRSTGDQGLADELAGVCKDYCLEVWTKALNTAGVPANSKWRKTESVYYPEDL